ncbi:repetitive organellar protein-like [Onthophagus taurus]|uniref:repetitive organellar protein-like n=1 Tax=Onthophagus taurus TaxID=166361 RepID=UPI0039BDE8AF
MSNLKRNQDFKEKRLPNFTQAEKYLLLRLTNQYKEIVENKKTDGFTWRKKTEAWKKIENVYNNSTSGSNRTARQLKYKYETIKRDLKREYTNNKNSWQPKSVEEAKLIKTITNIVEESLNNNNCNSNTLNGVDIDVKNNEQKIEFESDSSNVNNEMDIEIKTSSEDQSRNDLSPHLVPIETLNDSSKIKNFKRKKISFNNRRKLILIRQNVYKTSTERKLTTLMEETLKLLKNQNHLNSIKEDQLKEIHDIQMEILNAQKRQELLKEKYIQEEFKLKLSLSKLIGTNSNI